MEQSNNKSSVEYNCENEANANPDEYSGKNDNNQSAGDIDQNECAHSDDATNEVATMTAATDEFTTATATGPSHLGKISVNCFNELNKETRILSPISELSSNFPWSKLLSTCDILGE